MNETNLPISVESLLDLFPPDLLTQAMNYQIKLNDSVDDWMPRHINAAEQLCNYMRQTYPRSALELQEKLLLKLELIEEA